MKFDFIHAEALLLVTPHAGVRIEICARGTCAEEAGHPPRGGAN